MKTITLKADSEFDSLLSLLASRLHKTRSSIIRDAVHNYQQHLDREDLRKKILAASLKTRNQAIETATNFIDGNNDGL